MLTFAVVFLVNYRSSLVVLVDAMSMGVASDPTRVHGRTLVY